MGGSWGQVPKHLISIIAIQDVPPTLHTRQLEWVTGKAQHHPSPVSPCTRREQARGMWLETVLAQVCFMLCWWHPFYLARREQDSCFYLSMVWPLCLHLPYSFLLSSHSLPLLAGNDPNLNQMSWIFFFLFFQRRGCFTWQKPKMQKRKMQDRRTIFCNNQVHSFLGICSGFINFLNWLNCTYLI